MKKEEMEEVFERVRKFLNNEKEKKFQIILSNGEIEWLEKNLYESDVQVEITSKKNLSKGRIKITLMKMWKGLCL